MSPPGNGAMRGKVLKGRQNHKQDVIKQVTYSVALPGLTIVRLSCPGGSSLLALRRRSGGKAGTVRRRRRTPPSMVFRTSGAFYRTPIIELLTLPSSSSRFICLFAKDILHS